jgi:hypothetical protein
LKGRGALALLSVVSVELRMTTGIQLKTSLPPSVPWWELGPSTRPAWRERLPATVPHARG